MVLQLQQQQQQAAAEGSSTSIDYTRAEVVRIDSFLTLTVHADQSFWETFTYCNTPLLLAGYTSKHTPTPDS